MKRILPPFLFVGVAVSLLLALVARRRNGTAAVLPLPSPSITPTLPPPEPPASPRSPWLIFIALFSITLLLLAVLPRDASRLLFVVLVAGSPLVAARSAHVGLRDIGMAVTRSWKHTFGALVIWVGLHRDALAVPAAWAALAIMALAGFRFYTTWLLPWTLSEALRLTGIGTLLVGVAVFLRRPAIPRLDSPAVFNAAPPIRWRLTGAGAFALWLLAEINGALLHDMPDALLHYHLQVILFVTGILLVVRGLGGGWRWPRLERREWWALVGVTLLALGLRLWGLDSIIHRFVDEIHYANAITRLWTTPNTSILIPFGDITAFTWLYPYLQSGAVAILGPSLAGLRFVSVLLGTLTIPALYFLTRTLFDRRLALMAALVLAAFPPHIHFSRLALNNIADPFFGVLALALMARGFKSSRRSDFVLSGVMLGLTQYFYEGGRLLFPPLVILWFIISWLLGRRFDARPALAGLLVAALIAMPVYYTLFAQQTSLTPRLDREGLVLSIGGDLSPVRLETLLDPFLIYLSHPDLSWFYSGQHPLVLRHVVPIFLLGVAFMLWHLRKPGAWLIVLWVLLTSLGNILLRDRGWAPRYVVAFPVLALLIAAGLRYTLDWLWPTRRYLLAGVVVTVLTVAHTAFYFGDQMDRFSRQNGHAKDMEDVMFRAASFRPGTRVHIILPAAIWRYNIDTLLQFWNLELFVDTRFPVEVRSSYLNLLANQTTVDHAFFIEPDDNETLEKLRQHFYLFPVQHSPFNIPDESQMALYYAPRDFQHLLRER